MTTHTSADTPAILARLALEPERFRAQLQSQFSFRGAVVGWRTTARAADKQSGRKFYCGVLFGSALRQTAHMGA